MEKKYQITLCSLWNKENFIIEGSNEQDALDNLVAYLVNNNIGEGLYWEELESLDCEYSEEEIEEMEFVYIDATMNGANRPVYLLIAGMTIKQIKQGELFRLQPTDSAPVWVRGYYCREDKTFEAYKWDDTNHEGFFKGTKRVFVDFEF